MGQSHEVLADVILKNKNEMRVFFIDLVCKSVRQIMCPSIGYMWNLNGASK